MTELSLLEAVPLAHAVVDRVAEDVGVRALFIKGPVAFAQRLRRRRSSVDIDVLVDPERRADLAAALVDLGWVDLDPRRSPTVLPRHSLTLRHPTWPCELDLHDRFPGLFGDRQANFELLWERRTRVEVAAQEIWGPDLLGHAVILALHSLRDPYDTGKRADLAELVVNLPELVPASDLPELAELARDLGAADTAAPFLDNVGCPPVGRGTTSADDLRAWRLRTEPESSTAVGWIEELRRLPKRSWPGYLWYAAVLSEEELRLQDPSLPDGRAAAWGARGKRLRRGLAAMPSAVRSVRRSRRADAARGSAPAVAASRRVVVVQELMPGYRVPFFEALRARLVDHDVQLTVVHGFAQGGRASRADGGALPWAVTVDNRHVRLVPGMQAAVWEPVPRAVLRNADVVVAEQANRLLFTYVLLARYVVAGRPRLVLWGHGASLQAEGRLARTAERVKAAVSRRAHWWLAYTEGSADRVAALGFPRERITVVQNAVAIPPPSAAVDRVAGQCLYIGSLYRYKRIEYLLEAGRRAALLRPDFRLVVVGDGEDRVLVEEAAGSAPWLDYRGPLVGQAASDVLRQSTLLLMPGRVGLSVVDSFVAECPLVTVDSDLHSPEIEYLQDGLNGACLPAGTGPAAYAEAVAELLDNPARLEVLREGCREAAATYTLDAMVERYADGLLRALE